MSSETNLQQVLPAWLELASKTDVSLGLDPSEAFQRAERLLNDLRSGQASTEGWAPEADEVEVLHVIVALVCREAANAKAELRDIEFVFNFISKLPWPLEEFGGPQELLATCAFGAWRMARQIAGYPEIQRWVAQVRRLSDARAAADRLLSIPVAERESQSSASPELLLCICETLRPQLGRTPSKVFEEATFFHGLVEQVDGRIGLNDEREYLLGELALLAATSCRLLFRRGDARHWLHRANASFSLINNRGAHLARVEYQRLALLGEERRFPEILRLVPALAETFERLEMPEDGLKCRCLEGAALREIGQIHRATEVFLGVLRSAELQNNLRLMAVAANGLAQFYRVRRDLDRALMYARVAIPLLKQSDDWVGLAKLVWCVGDILREQGKISAAIATYREARAEAERLGMRWDLVSINLALAELLLQTGQEAQAESAICATLPIIDEEKMVPEGIAALSLLRESLLHRQIDHGALRDLHRHLEDRTR